MGRGFEQRTVGCHDINAHSSRWALSNARAAPNESFTSHTFLYSPHTTDTMENGQSLDRVTCMLSTAGLHATLTKCCISTILSICSSSKGRIVGSQRVPCGCHTHGFLPILLPEGTVEDLEWLKGVLMCGCHRSHCLLIIHASATDAATGVRSIGKLTLCDLAGSERINKTGATGASASSEPVQQTCQLHATRTEYGMLYKLPVRED